MVEHDNDFCRLIEASGPLVIWKIELEKNPWQDDLDLTTAEPAGPIEDYCWSVLRNAEVGPNRYVVNRGGYKLFSVQCDLNFFRVMLDLYERLAELHRRRVDVATKWLEANGCLARQAPSHLIPHTPEWFEVLEQSAPPQTMITHKIIEMTGRRDVCSICGDDPASNYYLAEEHRSAGCVDTFRLCIEWGQFLRNCGDPFLLL
jgi:hypothetical protein